MVIWVPAPCLNNPFFLPENICLYSRFFLLLPGPSDNPFVMAASGMRLCPFMVGFSPSFVSYLSRWRVALSPYAELAFLQSERVYEENVECLCVVYVPRSEISNALNPKTSLSSPPSRSGVLGNCLNFECRSVADELVPTGRFGNCQLTHLCRC